MKYQFLFLIAFILCIPFLMVHYGSLDLLKTHVDVSHALGRTHFIVGQEHMVEPIEKKSQKSVSSPCGCDPDDLDCLLRCSDGSIKQVLFAPDDNVGQAALYLIAHEKERIKMAIYAFTDEKIARALVDASKRGVVIEIVIDSSSAYDRFGKLPLVEKAGIKPYIYTPHSKGFVSDIMHNKVVLFYKNAYDRSLIWTGSFNFTQSARKRNQENVVILEDPYVFNRYAQQFETLKSRCR